ncbi:MAG: NADH-quinone oxidoreductase subunit B [Candidatus Nanopelagicales bacterium]
MRRSLSITAVNVACCAVESSVAVQRWQESHPADGPADLNVLVVAGTVTTANSDAVVGAFKRTPEPRRVVAFGVCTITGGPYWDSYSVLPGISELVPVDVFVPGCPPRPDDLLSVLEGLAGGRDAFAGDSDG